MNKNLKLLVSARSLITFATQMMAVVAAWQMYQLSHSAFYLGLVGFAQYLPMLLFFLPAGRAADVFDRRLIIILAELLFTLSAVTMAFSSHFGFLSKHLMLLLIFVNGTAYTFQGPSSQSLAPLIVSRKVFPRASALLVSAFQFSTIIGPAIGGFVIKLNYQIAYLSISICAVLSVLCISNVKLNRKKLSLKHNENAKFLTFFKIGFKKILNKIKILFGEGAPHPRKKTQTEKSKTSSKNSKKMSSLNELILGLKFIKSKPALLGSISLDMFVVLFGGATALLPIYASDILHINSTGYGILRSSQALGALMVSLYLSRKNIKNKVGFKMFLCVICFGIMTCLFSLSKSALLSIVILFLIGAFDSFSVVVRNSFVQISTPNKLRGRVSSVNLLFIGTSNQLGEFESGTVASLIGIFPTVFFGGILAIIITITWMFLFPDLRKLNNLTDKNLKI